MREKETDTEREGERVCEKVTETQRERESCLPHALLALSLTLWAVL